MSLKSLFFLAMACAQGCFYISDAKDLARRDADGDGFTFDVDCWDDPHGPPGSTLGGADVFPGAKETFYDGIDQDCKGDDDFDADSDGFVPDTGLGRSTLGVEGSGTLPGGDCWDDPSLLPDEFQPVPSSFTDQAGRHLAWEQPSAAEVHPGAPDTWYDGVNADCASGSDFDQDGDGYPTDKYPDSLGEFGTDCFDGASLDEGSPSGKDPADVNPGADETWYDGTDDDCDGNDCDKDLDAHDAMVGTCDGDDCDDMEPTAFPGATEVWRNGIDEDCDGNDCDKDLDGHDAMVEACHGDDCDDDAAGIHPGAKEIWYDGVDQDCDDADDCDQDGDGIQVEEGVCKGDDCDDLDADAYPGAPETPADGIDQDCSGGDACYTDADRDGFGGATIEASHDLDCADPGEAAVGGDCLDTGSNAHLAFPGSAPLDSPTACMMDTDGDAYGSTTAPGTGSAGTDCADSNTTIHPGATDLAADGTDQDCSGTELCYEDLDGDSYGTSSLIESDDLDCADEGESALTTDCDDGEATVHPEATELCDNGKDDDCDGDSSPCLFEGSVGLSTADVRLLGDGYGDGAGYSLSGAGDVNGDGLADILVGTESTDLAYLLLGPVTDSGWLSLADVTFTGEEGDAGCSVSSAGDVDADGLSDVLIGACTESSRGAAFLVLAPILDDMSLASADAQLTGEATSDQAGHAVAGAGDVNGDGLADLLVGAPYNDEGGALAGAAYLVLAPISTSTLSAASAKLLGENASDYAGYAVAGVGDVDGDGFDDLLVGAPQNDSGGWSEGAAYLVLGPVAGDLDLSAADAKLEGEDSYDSAGRSVTGAGDLNADGLADLLIGAPYADHTGRSAGAAYVVYGPTPGDGTLDAADARLMGESNEDWAGISAAGLGDVDHDGSDDVLVGAYQEDTGGRDSGAAYLIYGPLGGNIDLSASDSIFTGERSGDYAGWAVAGPGDVNGDAFAELLVGAYASDAGSSGAGAVYLIYGGGL